MKLQWKGRAWTPAALESDGSAKGRTLGAPLRVMESPRSGDRAVWGDCLDVAGALRREGLAGKVQVVYVDPPYLSQADYHHEARLDGSADGRVRRTTAYRDRWGGDDEGVGLYLDMLAPRLEALASLLAPTGTLWVQLDWRASYLARVILDEIFGRSGFKNEIVWKRAPNLGRQAASGQFGRTLDTLLVYGGPKARIRPPTRLEPIEPSAIRWDDQGRPFTSAPRGDYTDASVAKLDAEGRIHRTASGKVYVKYFLVRDGEGKLCRERRVDALWTDVPPLRHAQTSERTGYPTQKPLALLERIIACASEPGELVVDLFSGSGTTGEAAHRLGRRFVIGDGAPLAIATSRARLLRAGAALRIDACGVHASAGAPKAAPARVDVERESDGTVKVTLLEPTEPLAWAIDTAPAADSPFDVAWHAERRPGARAVPADPVARLPADVTHVAVRAYEDDGTVREETAVVPASSDPGTKKKRRASKNDFARTEP